MHDTLLIIAQNTQLQTTPNVTVTAVNGSVILFAVLVQLAIFVVICLLLYNAQKAIPPEHRRIEPGMIWLLLIPIFSLVWNFFVFLRIPDSYRSYFQSLGRDVGDAGRSIGLALAICAACTIVPCVNLLAAPAALVLLIIFLVKIYNLKGQIAGGGQGFPVGGPPTPPPPAV